MTEKLDGLELTGREIQCLHHEDLPLESETIGDQFDLDKLVTTIKGINVYAREKRDCPFARGNWIVDLNLKDGNIIALKYPLEMSEERFKEFVAPLLDKFELYMRKPINTEEC